MTQTWVSTSGQTYDLTDTGSLNDGAAPLATAREGGFTMRNRIEWANVEAPTLTNVIMNKLKILHIPERTIVEDVFLICPVGGTATTHATYSATVSSGVAEIGWIAYQSKSLASSSAVAGGFAQCQVKKSKMVGSGGSILALPTVATSPKGSIRAVKTGISGADHGWDDGGDDGQVGMHFPYGGYITFQLTGGEGTASGNSSWDAEFSGTTEIVARGWKVPE